MEIKLNAGDRFTIPTGCKATIEDNQIIIKEKQDYFKDGDILSVATLGDKTMPFIYKGVDERGFYEFYVGINYIGEVHFRQDDAERWGRDIPVHATEDEKQRLFDKLKEQGLRWNAETKEMERIRTRAKKGGEILIIAAQGGIITSYDDRDIIHDMLWNLGNYYLPNELEKAQEDFKAIRAIFEKRKIENI